MNILSIISIIIYTSFFIGAGRIITAERKTVLNVSACAVLICLGWWSFCNSFFFSADTIELAWFWHKLSSIGWCSFVAVTAYYFLSLTSQSKEKMKLWKQILFFLPSVILIIGNLFGKTTSLAQNIVLSANSWGLTYENSITSFWLWAYLLYVAVYFGATFYLLYRWAKTVKHRMKKEMAIGFIVLDSLTILFGVITDVVLPLTYPVVPALASIGTAFFAVGYFGIIYRHDIFNINLVISSDDILKTSNNAIFVIDENNEILKYNVAAGNLLSYNKSELIGKDFIGMMLNPINFAQDYSPDNLINFESKMRCKDQNIKDVLISASAAKDKRNNFLCMIVSCQDVTRQKVIQRELELQEDKYKKLAADYKQLANYDSLTGLPNRRCFFEALNAFEEGYKTEKKDFAVLFLDLDNFKRVNDLYGHKVGDDLLIATTYKLKTCIDNDEILARLGGDEFMIVMPYTNSDCVECKLQKIHEEFLKCISLNGQSYQIKLSVGSAVFSQMEDITMLMQIADEAMYENKQKKSRD